MFLRTVDRWQSAMPVGLAVHRSFHLNCPRDRGSRIRAELFAQRKVRIRITEALARFKITLQSQFFANPPRDNSPMRLCALFLLAAPLHAQSAIAFQNVTVVD